MICTQTHGSSMAACSLCHVNPERWDRISQVAAAARSSWSTCQSPELESTCWTDKPIVCGLTQWFPFCTISNAISKWTLPNVCEMKCILSARIKELLRSLRFESDEEAGVDSSCSEKQILDWVTAKKYASHAHTHELILGLSKLAR